MSKILTAYFSASGNTKRLAETIAKTAGSDIFEIVPEKKYTDDDLNWMNKQSRSSTEMKDRSYRPKIAFSAENIEKYDIILVGFPIWWYEAPRIIQSFLESYDFSGKTLIPFATSGGSGMGKTTEILKKSCGADVKWHEGKRFASDAGSGEIKAWLEDMKIL